MIGELRLKSTSEVQRLEMKATEKLGDTKGKRDLRVVPSGWEIVPSGLQIFRNHEV